MRKEKQRKLLFITLLCISCFLGAQISWSPAPERGNNRVIPTDLPVGSQDHHITTLEQPNSTIIFYFTSGYEEKKNRLVESIRGLDYHWFKLVTSRDISGTGNRVNE
jgi:hypothetical protein